MKHLFFIPVLLFLLSCGEKEEVKPAQKIAMNESKTALLHIEYSATNPTIKPFESRAKLVLNNKYFYNQTSETNNSNSIIYDMEVQGNQRIDFNVYVAYPGTQEPLGITRITKITFNGVVLFDNIDYPKGGTGYHSTLPYIY